MNEPLKTATTTASSLCMVSASLFTSVERGGERMPLPFAIVDPALH